MTILESRAVSPAISLVSRPLGDVLFLLPYHGGKNFCSVITRRVTSARSARTHIGDFDTRRCDRLPASHEFCLENVGQVSGILPTEGKTSNRRTSCIPRSFSRFATLLKLAFLGEIRYASEMKRGEEILNSRTNNAILLN